MYEKQSGAALQNCHPSKSAFFSLNEVRVIFFDLISVYLRTDSWFRRGSILMKVVALISGGKDSIKVMMECVQMGHDIIALAHLSAPKEVHELDSYMYQSIGSCLVTCIGKCMELPLLSREITGTSTRQTLHYEKTEGDEVEDMYMLLQDVLVRR